MVNSAASSARCWSASSNTSTGDLPPSSIDSRLMPARSAMRWPVAVPPVKEMVRTSGWRTSASPASEPWPCTMLSTPLGTPASSASRPSRSAVMGDSSDIFSTAVLPSARQGATFQVAVISGTFQGEISPHTPTGCSSVW